MKIHIFLPTLINRKEQEDATRRCLSSITSDEHILNVQVDNRDERWSLTQKWNQFLDYWRDRAYEYLLIIANDTIAKSESIDYLVKFMKDNPNIGIGESKLNRDLNSFSSSEINYSKNYRLTLEDTSNFIIRKGVIETVGRFNEKRFAFAYNERDYTYRCKLANILVVQTEMNLFYHPRSPLTLENRGDFNEDVRKYTELWGGDWTSETYNHPFNNPSLDYTFSDY